MKQTQEDKIISEFLKSLGPWREGCVEKFYREVLRKIP